MIFILFSSKSLFWRPCSIWRYFNYCTSLLYYCFYSWKSFVAKFTFLIRAFFDWINIFRFVPFWLFRILTINKLLCPKSQTFLFPLLFSLSFSLSLSLSLSPSFFYLFLSIFLFLPVFVCLFLSIFYWVFFLFLWSSFFLFLSPSPFVLLFPPFFIFLTVVFSGFLRTGC